jgi:hypothetical protein
MIQIQFDFKLEQLKEIDIYLSLLIYIINLLFFHKKKFY